MESLSYVLYIIALLGLVFVVFFSIRGIRAYFRYRGKHLVTCPETHQPTAVDVNARRAAWDAAGGDQIHLHLSDCSRWPERAGCPEDCVPQIEADPRHTRVISIVKEWYAKQKCVYCSKPIGDVDWLDDWLDKEPALLDAKHQTAQWNELAPETLPLLFEKLRPVCWNCHITETFRRDHEDLVTDRLPH